MPIEKLPFHTSNAYILLEISCSNAFRMDVRKLQHSFQLHSKVSEDEFWNSLDYLIKSGCVASFLSGTEQYHGIQLVTKGFQVLIGEVRDQNICI